MRILFNHADSFEFEVTKKAISNPEEITDQSRAGKSQNSLVAFMAVEKTDEGKEDAVAERAVAEVEDVYKKVGAGNIVVYPYAHLSSNLSSPAVAKNVLDMVYEKLKSRGYTTTKAPFGWYKAFRIECKGHPLSELSREIIIEEIDKSKAQKLEESEALKAESKMVSSWAVLTPDGKMHPLHHEGLKGFDFSKHPNLKKFAAYELVKSRDVDKVPPHVVLMRRLELVDYEPGSDPGNLRYYPKGRLVKSLLEDFVTNEVKNYGGMEVETPIMYDFEHPSLKKYLNRFPARQYTIETPNKKVFLRFAACFGQFLMMHDATVSYKDLPLRLYELTKYSFRVEKRGELTGMRRLRTFTMPDCHAFVADLGMAKEEMLVRLGLARGILEKCGVGEGGLEMGLRLVKSFYEENTEFVHSLVKSWGKPVLVEMWDSRFFYFMMKYELNFIDCLDNASALTTDQIDVENAKTYDIKYIDKDGSEKHPLIMHLSPSGAIERVMYSLLEQANMDKVAGNTPRLPLWLSPTQVRVVPITENNLKYASKVREELATADVRADIDDRNQTLGKKIKDAEEEWVPYIAVIGEKEESEKSAMVRIRGGKEQKKMKIDELIKLIKKETEGMPFKSLPLPPELSKRPKFVG